MATNLQKIWQFLNTDIRELGQPGEVAEAGAEVSKSVLELALALGLLSASPTAPIAVAGLSFVGIARQGVKLFREKTQKEPTLEEWVAVASPLAYVESFNQLVQRNDFLQQISKTPISEPVKQQIEKLRQFQLDEQLAKNALTCFHKSELAQAFNQILSNQLQQAGIAQNQAQILTAWVAWDTQRYMKPALAAGNSTVRHLAALYDSVQLAQDKYNSIDNYIKHEIAEQLNRPVFAEIFTFRDIYVPLKAQVVNASGQLCNDTQPFEIESWARNMLQNPSKQGQMIFIQGGPGRGKSVFCRMFADWVRQHFHPLWTPILIRLRDIPKLQESFQSTLRDAVNRDFATSDSGWLTDRDTRFLFMLDGFDELVMQGRASGGLREFLQQVGQFQRDCHRNPELGHRVLITGRPLALYGIERFMPDNLERVELLPMDDELQQKWFAKWEKLVEPDKALEFQQFLQDSRCPAQVRELAREPLLLYLLAAMHRDGELTVQMSEAVTDLDARIRIYEKSLDWLLTKQRSDSDHSDLNHRLTNLETEDLKRILAEAAVCVVQSGGECAAMEMVAARLKNDEAAQVLLQQVQEQHGDHNLINALSVFYLQQGTQKGAVEFTHKSFSEFLCAQRLKESILEWTRPGFRRQVYAVSKEVMDWEIYDLLGYGGLTPEIVDYLMALLTKDNEFEPTILFKRLEDFYLRWCEGEFIDSFTETLPQKKSRQLNNHNIPLGQRQVDVFAGLNVLILLLELNRYARQWNDLKDKIAFYPCGQPDNEGFDAERLLRIDGYSYCLGVGAFNYIVGLFLSNAYLEETNLSGVYLVETDFSSAYLLNANFSGADLSYAILSGAYLVNADCSGANFSEVDFSGAELGVTDFSGTNLISTNLSGTDLTGANLSGANLTGADLSGAFLHKANFSGTDLEDIFWNNDTKWEDVRGLETAVNVPEALKRQLGLE